MKSMNDNRSWEQRMEAVNKGEEPISLVMHKFYSYREGAENSGGKKAGPVPAT